MLNEKHREEFAKSGISDAMIEAAGIYTANSKIVHTALGWKSKDFNWGDGWCVPFKFPDEVEPNYFRIKLDWPRSTDSNKPIKYESPKGAANRLYFPPGVFDAIKEKGFALVTEGEKKALKATQEGFPCIGLVGVWGWQNKRPRKDNDKPTGPKTLISDFKHVPLSGLRVYVTFDSDAVDNPQVKQAETEFASVLRGQGADVRVVRLPGNGDKKVGLDDFLMAGGDLKSLLDAAIVPRPVIAVQADDRKALMALADQYISEHLMCGDQMILRSWRDDFWIWNGVRYQSKKTYDLRAQVLVWLDKKVGQATPKTAGNIVDCLAARGLVTADFDMPCWLDGAGKRVSDWVCMENGLINVNDILEGNLSVRDHTPLWFSPIALPYAFDPLSECPRWVLFLNEVMDGDRDLITVLQRWCGYNLVADVDQHKFLMCPGEGSNGKSVFLDVLTALLGSENVSSVSLEDFSDRFALSSTIGKLANIVAEVGEVGKTDEGKFKRFVAGDSIQIDRKHMDPMTVRPTARVTLATNTLPRWSDKSQGMWRRVLIVPFKVQIEEGKQDRKLAQRIIETELPGVFNWALHGLWELRKSNGFPEAAASRQAMDEWRDESNPARIFLQEECEASVNGDIGKQELYDRYKKWCDNMGHRAMSEVHFAKEVYRMFPNVAQSRPRSENRQRRWTGLMCSMETS